MADDTNTRNLLIEACRKLRENKLIEPAKGTSDALARWYYEQIKNADDACARAQRERESLG